jgi:hypothetical protein
MEASQKTKSRTVYDPTIELLGIYLKQTLFLCVWYWALNSRPTPLATSPARFCEGFFRGRVS